MTRRRVNKERRSARRRAGRRESMLILLGRLQRRVPVRPAEAALLRAHVMVEIDEADQARHALSEQQVTHRHQLEAAHEAIREAEQDAADAREQLRMYRAVEEHQAATEERARTPQPVRPDPGRLIPLDVPKCPVTCLCRTTSTPEPQS